MSTSLAPALSKHASGVSILWGGLLIIFGMVAISAPLLAAIAVSALISWLIILAGCVHLMLAVRAHSAGSVVWKLLVGLAYVIMGGYLLLHPLLGVASLTLLLGSLFIAEGVFDLVLYFQMRSTAGSAWVLIDAIVTLLLGVLIWAHWPSSSAWAIGTLVGVSMIMSGIARVMLTMAVRRVIGGVPQFAEKRAA